MNPYRRQADVEIGNFVLILLMHVVFQGWRKLKSGLVYHSYIPLINFSILAALSCFIFSETCPYTSNVNTAV
jgi:hypothetical protein